MKRLPCTCIYQREVTVFAPREAMLLCDTHHLTGILQSSATFKMTATWGPLWAAPGGEIPYYQGPYLSQSSTAFGCFLCSPSVALKHLKSTVLHTTKRLSTCLLGFRFGWSWLMVTCHWLRALGTVMCEMPSDGKPRQTTALSASHRPPCFAFLTVLLCATYAMHFLLMHL